MHVRVECSRYRGRSKLKLGRAAGKTEKVGLQHSTCQLRTSSDVQSLIVYGKHSPVNRDISVRCFVRG